MSTVKLKVYCCNSLDTLWLESSTVSLSGNDTIADLKHHLYNKFRIHPSKQVLEGWFNSPSCDASMLGNCILRNTKNKLILRNVENMSDEDEKISIIVQFNNAEHAIRIHESTTVEFFKILLEAKFEIYAEEIILEGWKVSPMSDKNILLYCCYSGEITNLTIKIEGSSQSKYDDNFLEEPQYDDHFLEQQQQDDSFMEKSESDSPELSSKGGQMRAISSFFDKVSEFPSKILTNFCHLEDAIRDIAAAPLKHRKIILLFFYKEKDPFSKTFLNTLKSKEFDNDLASNFLLIGWDVEEIGNHDALRRTLNKYAELSNLTAVLQKCMSTVVGITFIEDSLTVNMALSGKVTVKEILKAFQDAGKGLQFEREQEEKLKEIEDNVTNHCIGSVEFQYMMMARLGDRDYDLFEHNQHDLLRDKIGFALRGPPESETGYDKNDKDINKILNLIKSEAALISQYKDVVEISFIYNCVEPLPSEKVAKAEKAAKAGEKEKYNPKTDMVPYPVFVLRKCRNSENPCRVFIDHIGRVYSSWTSYLTENKLPKCKMVLPLDGRYQASESGLVRLETHMSPACGIDKAILMGTDITAAVGGVLSGGVILVAAIPAITVAPALIVAGTVGGTLAGLYAIGRSIHSLVDRGMHKETMNVTNSEARGAYINIVAGSLGFFGAGANLVVSQLAARGFDIAQGFRTTVTVINVANITVSGAGIGNSMYDVFDQYFNEDQRPSALTMVQLATSILFFGNAVYSFRTGTMIVEEAQQQSMQDFQESLRSNRHRKTFNKLTKATMAEHGGDTVKARAAIISTIKNMQNKDEVFAVLTRTNKAMNRNGVKFTASDGEIKLNGMSVDMNLYASMSKGQADAFLGQIAKGSVNSGSAVSTPKVSTSVSSVQNISTSLETYVPAVSPIDIVSCVQRLIPFINADIQEKILIAVDYLLGCLSPMIMKALEKYFPGFRMMERLILIVTEFFANKSAEYEEKYKLWNQTKSVDFYEPLFEKINMSGVNVAVQIFQLVVGVAFCNRGLVKSAVDNLINYFNTWFTKTVADEEIKSETEEERRVHSASWRRICKECAACKGVYFAA